MKKGRHRRYEEARALKQNQDLDLDAIFDSLDVVEGPEGGDSPAFDAWSEEFGSEEDGEDEGSEEFEETAESA